MIKLFRIPFKHRTTSFGFFENTAQSPFTQPVDESQSRAKNLLKKFQVNQQQLTPERLVQYLDRHVIGQLQAKRAIACAFRNRWRRRQLPQNIRSEIVPKNILIKGPTGSGKTEIARRLAKLTDAPFLRVEATKYTEVGYVGKDVSTIIQDNKARMEKTLKELAETVKEEVYLQILNAMVGDSLPSELRQKKLNDLKKGYYNDQIVTLIPGYKVNLQIDDVQFPTKTIVKPVKEMAHYLYNYYYDKLKSMIVNVDSQKQAIKNVQQDGIIFLDQIDKLAVPQGSGTTGKGVSTEGVQRDLLPIIEGTTVSTKFGDVKTDHILFIASGSFSMAKIQDLIPQLLGRLPIRVSLAPLSKAELVRILKQPQFNLIFQQMKLLSSEKVTLSFKQQAIDEIAEQAFQMNTLTENLGARRLHSIIQKIIQDISFTAPKHKGQTFTIDRQYVREKLKNEVKSIDLTRFLI